MAYMCCLCVTFTETFSILKSGCNLGEKWLRLQARNFPFLSFTIRFPPYCLIEIQVDRQEEKASITFINVFDNVFDKHYCYEPLVDVRYPWAEDGSYLFTLPGILQCKGKQITAEVPCVPVYHYDSDVSLLIINYLQA